MKTKDVKIGETYYTYIGEALAPVIVVREVNVVSSSIWDRPAKIRTMFEVRRPDSDTALPKRRTAAALREKPVKKF